MNSVYEEHGAMGSHRYCLLCGSENPLSMRLSFRNNQDGSVTADFQSHNHLQGYNGIMHGGVISALLDSVMTNCLFRNGIEAVTGELTVKFFESVPCNARVHLSAKIEKSMSPLYLVSAQLLCNGKLMAGANAKFMMKKV
jgi:acyl-coenzyme A thioesterase PaaI-like protein